jgi:hypothetical protein
LAHYLLLVIILVSTDEIDSCSCLRCMPLLGLKKFALQLCYGRLVMLLIFIWPSLLLCFALEVRSYSCLWCDRESWRRLDCYCFMAFIEWSGMSHLKLVGERLHLYLFFLSFNDSNFHIHINETTCIPPKGVLLLWPTQCGFFVCTSHLCISYTIMPSTNLKDIQLWCFITSIREVPWFISGWAWCSYFLGEEYIPCRFVDVFIMFQCSELKDSILSSLFWWFYSTGLCIVICIMGLVCIFLWNCNAEADLGSVSVPNLVQCHKMCKHSLFLTRC